MFDRFGIISMLNNDYDYVAIRRQKRKSRRCRWITLELTDENVEDLKL